MFTAVRRIAPLRLTQGLEPVETALHDYARRQDFAGAMLSASAGLSLDGSRSLTPSSAANTSSFWNKERVEYVQGERDFIMPARNKIKTSKPKVPKPAKRPLTKGK